MENTILTKSKRLVSALMAGIIALSAMPLVAVSASADSSQQKYPYVMFAEDKQGGISINATGLTINGDIYTNGTFNSTHQYGNINGKIIDINDIEITSETSTEVTEPPITELETTTTPQTKPVITTAEPPQTTHIETNAIEITTETEIITAETAQSAPIQIEQVP